MFEWNEKFNIGIKLIDDQHQELFRIASKVHALLHDEFTFDKYDKMIALISDLKDYTVFHFKAEEEYMKQIKSKGYFTQKVEHDSFIEKLNAIDIYHIDENQDEYLAKILNDVSTWIINHILEKDMKIASK